jgi:phosphate acetyltransferase
MIDLHGPIKGKGVRIAFPESTEPRTLQAVRILLDQKLCVPVLVGNPDEIHAAAKQVGVSVDGMEIVPIVPDKYAQQLAEIRKEKGLSVDEARELLKDCMYFATMLLHFGIVDGAVSGAVHPTAHTLKPALQIIKTKPHIDLASSFFLMQTPKGVYFFSDCSLNIEYANAEELAAVGIATAQTARKFGVSPRVAFLSFSTKGSGKHERAERVARAAALAAKAIPDIPVDGELQVDAAMDEVVCKLKAPNSPIAGKANVFIFPNLESGNIGYKLVQRFSGAKAIGPIVQGLKKPVNDLSRGCTVEEIVEVASVTALQVLHGV